MTQKYGAWTVPGARETARIAWRARVNAAARAWGSAILAFRSAVDGPSFRRACVAGPDATRLGAAMAERDRTYPILHAALTAPRPWRSTRRPDPRRRYSRRHRMGCWWCSTAKWLEVRHIGNEEMTRDPHGFRRHHFAMHGRRS